MPEILINRDYTQQQIDAFLKAITELSKILVTRHGVHVLFLPMHTTSPDDDRVPAHLIKNRISDEKIKQNLHIIDEQYGPREAKGILGRMDAVIGVRFHSLVLSGSMGIPNYTVGSAPKNKAVMQFFGREDYVQMISELEETQLIGSIEEILKNPQQHCDQLRKRNNEINVLYDRELDTILDIVMRQCKPSKK